jgi:hypothetical protein
MGPIGCKKLAEVGKTCRVPNQQNENQPMNILKMNERGKIMRCLFSLTMVMCLVLGMASVCLAEDAKTATTSDAAKVDAKVDVKTDASAGAAANTTAATAVNANAGIVELRAAIHRTCANLIEAQGAKDPDQTKIAELTQNLQQLRAKLYAQLQTSGAGQGYGRRGGWGRGFGSGRGMGYGLGVGQGTGAGQGTGMGQGAGAGQGVGRPFVDNDHDGVCDFYELRYGLHK